MRTTQKEIRNFPATDVTNWLPEDVATLVRVQNLREVAYSAGTYGCNGVVMIDLATGEFFKVVNRSTNLFILM